MIVLIAETIERKNDLLFAELPRVTETVVVLPNPCQASLSTQVRTQHQPHHHHHRHLILINITIALVILKIVTIDTPSCVQDQLKESLPAFNNRTTHSILGVI